MLHTPTTEAQACAVVASIVEARVPLAIRGGGTRTGLGRPDNAVSTISSSGLNGITLYEPAEMVIGAKAGTPLKLIEETLAARGQMLPFEPMDHRALLGTEGEPTIGAIAAGNISGPRRINAGAARDSLIGIKLINGRGELVKSGGRVMKNVTGLDLVKLVAGSFGTLGFLTEVTFRVLPRPERVATLIWEGLSDEAAVALLSGALGSPFEPMAAAHLPAGIGAEEPRTLLRLENFSASISYRAAELARLLKAHGRPELVEGRASEALWREVRDASFSPARRRLSGGSRSRRPMGRERPLRSRALCRAPAGSTIGAAVSSGSPCRLMVTRAPPRFALRSSRSAAMPLWCGRLMRCGRWFLCSSRSPSR